MKKHLLLCLATAAFRLSAAELSDPSAQAKVTTRIAEIVAWAADPVIVEAVKARNAAGLEGDMASMTQEKWRSLSVLDPFVRSFSKNPAGQFLKSKKDAWVTLTFLSDAAGYKVAFTAKTTNWCHKGQDKHEVPMTGKIWQGPVEVNQASGLQQIQVAVPVLDGGKPIGSLVVGLSVLALSGD